MDSEAWFVLGVNPEPWAVGPLDVIRRGGKLAPTMGRNQQLDAYKQAVRDELSVRYPDAAVLPAGYVLDFYFWRNRASYRTEQARRVRKNEADATNLGKATEDALQGVLIGNDRDVVSIRNTIVAQGPYVMGAVAFKIAWGVAANRDFKYHQFPEKVISELAKVQIAPSQLPVSDNSWPPRK